MEILSIVYYISELALYPILFSILILTLWLFSEIWNRYAVHHPLGRFRSNVDRDRVHQDQDSRICHGEFQEFFDTY